eukprot:TRINITY_DN95619_c0_g1_i1.p1 TRINITY_DN95619_c0_g1~~TRINITY_DN95619_c0_g1_i1.p1  ORF type:complete len:296 (-),score=78.68 TRINITY_DN95619_c0_g1_i1:43-930(-)
MHRARSAATLLLAVTLRISAATKASGSWTSDDGAGNWWPSLFSFRSAPGSLPPDVKALVHAPGDGAWQDEARPVQQQGEASLRASGKSSVALISKATETPLVSLAELPQHVPQSKTVEEYDVKTGKDARDTAAEGVLAALFTETPSKAESATREEELRQATDAVTRMLAPKEEAPEIVSPPKRHHVPRPASLALASQGSKSSRNGKPDMQEQCMSFAKWAKSNGIQGKELTKLIMSTCASPAHSQADATFKKMCTDLEGEISKLQKSPNWLPVEVCDTVVKLFKQSGIGANPLVD